MNGRILELLKNPDLVVDSDLKLLQSEIENIPYAQSIRALYLYGTHRLNPADYSEILSETAAYTTDKKNIYQFINKNSVRKSEVPTPMEAVPEEPESILNVENHVYTEIVSEERSSPKEVHVNGELNRILFEGEEDFMERDNVAIDLEQTKESGVIVTHPAEKTVIEKQQDIIPEVSKEEPELPGSIKSPDIIECPEVSEIIEEKPQKSAPQKQFENDSKESEEPPRDEPIVADTSLNFHGTDEFLPDVKISASSASFTAKPISDVLPTKHELEMQRLIAEVEAKMKKRRRNSEPENEPVADKSLDFADVQEFDINNNSDRENQDAAVPEITPSSEEISKIENIHAEGDLETSIIENKPAENWNPMSFSGNTPDSHISKTEEKPEILKKDSAAPGKQVSEQEDTGSAFNISFFTQEVTSLETEAADDLIRDLKEHIDPQETEEPSNVPVFINTWQKWLKIERTTAVPEVSNVEVKSKVIENFIVKEPKISKLKEESDFVVKDRGDNISHLMTETLAKLYTEQKLYAKAIKAYETLTEKHPDKKSHFAEQIKLIKELRQNRQP